MVGQNQMALNEATMIEVVQYWLDNKSLNKDEPRPKVTGVDKTSNGRYDAEFTISLDASAKP